MAIWQQYHVEVEVVACGVFDWYGYLQRRPVLLWLDGYRTSAPAALWLPAVWKREEEE